MQGVTESMAGRAAVLQLRPFSARKSVLKKRGLQRDTLGPHALAERFDREFLGNRTGEEPWQGRILASEVFSELPRSGTENERFRAESSHP